MAEKSGLRETLTNIARQARSLLEDFDENNLQSLERSLRQTANPQSGTASGNQHSRSASANQQSGAAAARPRTTAAELIRSFPTLSRNNQSGRSVSRYKKPPPKKPKKDSVVHKDVVLLPSPATKAVPTHQTRCQLENNGFVIHGFPLDKSMEEADLRSKIRDLFPVLQDADFHFVKSCYGQIVTPKLASGVTFSAARVLGIAGQGSIYIRPEQDIAVQESNVVSDDESPPSSPVKKMAKPSSPPYSALTANDDSADLTPGPSSRPTNQESFIQLREMFPNKDQRAIEEALTIRGSVSSAALSLVQDDNICEQMLDSEDDEILMTSCFAKENEGETDLKSILKKIEKKMVREKEKVKVDEEDILNDALCYYKNPAFDEKKPIRVLYRGQPACDTGGVTRQFYTQLLDVISQSFFIGNNYKIPIYNPEIVASKLMKYIGAIVVHSIVQGGPGFPIFSPAVYKYLCTGDTDQALADLSIADCTDPMKHFILRVAEAEDVGTLDQEECTNILAECGITIPLTNDNKMMVIQALIIHDVISRPKIVLDQLAEGLETLGFRAKMKDHPKLLKSLFVYGERKLSSDSVIGILKFPEDMTESQTTIKTYLEQFLAEADSKTLEDFLQFASGATCLPNFGLARIKIKFSSSDSIFASTCLLSITFPNCFEDFNSLSYSLKAVVDNAKQAFNCV